MANVMAMYGIEVTPQSLNQWMNLDATPTSGGWVSRGYAYGNVLWTTVNAFSAEAVTRQPDVPTVALEGWGSGTEDELQAELEGNHPAILEVPGHFISVVGLEDGELLINDPYYRDRTTLAAYTGRVVNSRIFRPSQDLSALVITVPANLRVLVTDAEGNTTGTLESGAPSAVAEGAVQEIPASVYRYEAAWRDPTCLEPPPDEQSGVNTIVITNPKKQTFEIEVVNPDGGGTTVAIHGYDKDGNVTVVTVDEPGNSKIPVPYDPNRQPSVTGPTTAGAPPTFEDHTEDQLPDSPNSGQDAVFGDVDSDGDLDIFSANGRYVYPSTPVIRFPYLPPRLGEMPYFRGLLSLRETVFDVSRPIPTPRPADVRPFLEADRSRLLLNDGRGFYTDVTETNLPRLFDATADASFADFDSDGDLDLFLANDGAQDRLLLNDGRGGFTDGTAGRVPTDGQRAREVESADLNGDDLVDLLVAAGQQEGSAPPARLLINTGAARFRDDTSNLPRGTPAGINHLLPIDVDGDRDLDVFVSAGDESSERPRLWINSGRATFSDETGRRLPDLKLRAEKADAGDVDRDDDPDLMLAIRDGPVRLFTNDGSGVFTDATEIRLPPTVTQMRELQLADFDGDRDLDLLLIGSFALLINDGSGGFSDVTGEAFPVLLGSAGAGRWGDIDGDGDLDIFAARFNNKLNLLLVNTRLKPTEALTAEQGPSTPTPTPSPAPALTATPTPPSPPPPPPPPTLAEPPVLPTGCFQLPLGDVTEGFNTQFSDTLQGLTDEERQRYALPRLYRDARARLAAEDYARFLVQSNWYVENPDPPAIHEGPAPTGSDPGARLNTAGAAWSRYAENIYFVGEETDADPCRSFKARTFYHQQNLLQDCLGDPACDPDDFPPGLTWYAETACYFAPSEYACVQVFLGR